MPNRHLTALLSTIAVKKVMKILKNDGSFLNFLKDYKNKKLGLNLKKEVLVPFISATQTIIRLLIDYKKGIYRDVSPRFLVIAIATIVYFIVPIDAIFDFLPGGYTDDIALLSYFLSNFDDEIQKYKAWKRLQQKTKVNHISPHSNSITIQP